MTETRTPLMWCGEEVLRHPMKVLAAVSTAYIAVDTDGRVLAWNRAAADTFGYQWREACGRRVQDLIIVEQYRARLELFLAGSPAEALRQHVTTRMRHRDGHEFPVEMTVTATDDPGGRIYHAFLSDVTVAQRASRFTAVEAAVSRGLAEAESSAAAAQRLVEAVGVQMGWPVTELWVPDEERRVLTCAARHLGPAWRLTQFVADEVETGRWLPGRVYQSGRPQWIPDLGADTGSSRSRIAAEAGLRVAVGVPISTGGQILGALCVYGDYAEDPENTLIALLGGVAAQLGQYLERRRAEELAIDLARTKDEFLALVTHELRNPLAVITSTASFVDDELDTLTETEQRSYLSTIAGSAQRLSAIADDLLDLARLESGHLTVEAVDTDLSAVIRAAIDAFRPQATGKNLTVDTDMPERLPLHGDPHRLRQVADNLLSNAIKYTPAGGRITITATVDARHITWTVADTGIGIPEADRPRLFRRFYRASSARARHIPGTGLGLVITRAIVERHDGSIGLAAHSGPGTTFVVRLPANEQSRFQ
ncbi:ATP-binding protein [Actinoplanes sp. KI2]|uniref:sensor histidine kinase n=1 Tax=Actinoplanes sp. KI2 TaxID=2983315 RepID=UPI0021D5A3A2|nr:ATP-binding protein [Actinoplanes sp. KI2]MCU7723198.1 ATP-binding protein [Actinoplanes sp. KI2]